MHEIILSFALIVCAGVFFRRLRAGGLDAGSLHLAINTFVFNLFLPALCIKTVYSSEIDIDTLLVPVTAGLTTVLTMLVSLGVYSILGKLVKMEKSEQGVLVISATFGNVVYLGLPVITGLYGEGAAKYALFYDLFAATPLLWLLGSFVASRYGGTDGEQGRAGRARIMAAGSKGSKAAASRPQMALALAVESCCATMIAARPAKPSGRRRSGGRPAAASSAAKRGSIWPSAASAASRSASV